MPGAPVGQAPAPAQVAAIPAELGVLTPPGQLVLDPSLEYVRTSNNRLVFRGVEIVPGIQLGVIEASDADRDTGVANISARYGLTNRLEVELRAPYVVRHDRITTLAQRDETISRNIELDGRGIGDIEASLRYQLNGGRNGWPIFVATARAKSPTGLGPYEVDYDEFGVASELATGSGFWAVESGLTLLYPTDPAVIFGGLTYLHNFGRDIDRDVGGAFVGRVEPGASIGASLGFGLSLNPRFSVSFGYTHNYIRPTRTEIGGTDQSSQPLQVGSLLMGWSFRLGERLTLNSSFEFGVTSDAPDVRIVLRTPYRF
ncbi:transporter [Phenylobacterium sp.]|uniref:transporter n=1 Tax=Phenylobacterium sp. TaxID=1871053 RepID=UPI002C73E115|nr:transporter [Phenylobacterium sp.]HVI30577.1 transporter [Phenylobacterium sp.]